MGQYFGHRPYSMANWIHDTSNEENGSERAQSHDIGLF
jgi:hypothetical protein